MTTSDIDFESSRIALNDRYRIRKSFEAGGGEIRRLWRRTVHQGNRIKVAVILDSLAEGLSPKEITKHFPPLTEQDVRAAVAYAKGER